MSEPTTANIGLIVPNTGDLSGAWGTAALNVNAQQLDGLFGGVLNLSLSAATTITLTTGGASLTPGAGPNQSNNAAIILNGTLTGNSILKFTQPGHYTIFNNTAGIGFYVQLAPSVGTGFAVAVPAGEMWRALYDGTNMHILGMPHVTTLVNLCVSTTPAWMNGWTVAPYLFCNGATYNVSTFVQLSGYLGNTFGGNGVTTFGVPDMQNRYFIPMDFGANGRVTNAGCLIDGTAFGAAGGNQNLAQHNHNVNDPSHNHGLSNNTGLYSNAIDQGFTAAAGGAPRTGFFNLGISAATTGITISNTGSGFSGNIPPGIVAGMTFIKT